MNDYDALPDYQALPTRTASGAHVWIVADDEECDIYGNVVFINKRIAVAHIVSMVRAQAGIEAVTPADLPQGALF